MGCGCSCGAAAAGARRTPGVAVCGAGHRTHDPIDVGGAGVDRPRVAAASTCAGSPAARAAGVGIIARVPLASGLLTGKYQNGAMPSGSRMSLNDDLGGRKTDRAFTAVGAYLNVAKKHDLDPVQMALAWCCTRPFMGSVIFGATSLAQLDIALGADDLTLGDEVMKELDAVHRAHPMPY